MKKVIIIACMFLALPVLAQKGKVLEEVVAVVGDNIILKSELEAEYLQAQNSVEVYEGDLKCEILNQLIIQKLYLHKGDLDSVVVDNSRVESEVERRIQFYATQIGGEQKLEQYLGKSISEYKIQMRPKIKEQMITQQVQQSLISSVKVSPTEIQKFFKEIPKDSLPEFEKEVELGVVVMQPTPSDFAKSYARKKLASIREDIINGLYQFEVAAKSQSEDPGTAPSGGELGYFGRGQMVGAFEREAFKLKKDSISQIIETEFGFHILKYIDRKGEKVNVRHILIKPLIVSSDNESLLKTMNLLRDSLASEKVGFCKVASTTSVDPYTKDNCGFYSTQGGGSQSVPLSQLEPSIQSKLDQLTVGAYSRPEKFLYYDQSTAYRFFYLKSVKPAHKANLDDDYTKVQQMALSKRQDQEVEKWVDKYRKDVYVWIDDKYKNCKELEGWKGLSN